ncbi:uncharacterized protein LOC123515221 isoform X1 [Portunus trituberculatus]|uniref:uncharacterized protein LOC123515221 isoform X1 n=1 Tax=Portunus trituberculatus TaxID=210409 RepID=UPI001E1D0B1E|nr:uncharacterized protein LOC123515221 isoform X1 [Portunus trituberculatus]
MSDSKQPRWRDLKASTPSSAQPGLTGPSVLHQKTYSLNLKAATPSSPAAYKVPKPKKIGRIQLWARRNPQKFHFFVVTLGISILFSRPIYDIFIKGPSEGPRPSGKKFGSLI